MQKYINILKYAMEMEKQGHHFYKTNAERFSSATAKELFERLAEVELDHYHFLEEQLNYYIKFNQLQDYSLDSNREADLFDKRFEAENIEQSLHDSLTPDLTILRMAYLIERDYAEFYKKQSEEAEDKNIVKLFKTLATWEEGHQELFKAEYDRRMEEYINGQWG
ncbi:ferritin-like domain-containing protein [Alkaliphilus serpentinus]|uniref:Ferritin family protein n=1 Tax=Alkaliphilus serpentinus TaxID=1482731 RepID=A0A833HRM5_9FIRM|nr:ferritin family protein [Alkaliphilus serpentinus]KAB3533524.1 ferritin family protein [Alkaliphilus serpentinus]